MGDMADDFLDNVEDFEELRLMFHMGELSVEEALELGIIDEDGYEDDGSSETKS